MAGGASIAELRQMLDAAQAHLADGDPEAAETLVRRVVAALPDESEGFNALGVVLRHRGRGEEARDAFVQALALDPDNVRARANLAASYGLDGDHREAVAEARLVVAHGPEAVAGWRLLANCLRGAGAFDEALDALGRARALAPEDGSLTRLEARILHDGGSLSAAADAYARHLERVPGDIESATDLGMVLAALGRENEAIERFEAVLALKPDHLPAEFGLREAIARVVPPWHLPMMNEPDRNNAYRDAIRAVVRPGDVVLDIGTGAGLLALLAAEAGGGEVVTCEMVQVVAEEATAIVAKSGWADRIKVVPKKSTALEVGVDLSRRADVLVSEIFADDLVGEGVLSSLVDARRRLIRPDAAIVPARGRIMGVLVGGAEIEYLLGLGDVCGFDMASFARLRPWRQPISRMIDYDALSDDFCLFEYDFTDPATLTWTEAELTVPVTRPGTCHGLLQWIALDLAPGVTYENHPRSKTSVWNKQLYAFPRSDAVTPGERIDVRLWQRADYLYLTSPRFSY